MTVGVCIKNSEKTIKETIDSIINQQYPTELIQLIVVDGCSKDKTMSMVDNLTKKTKVKVETYSDEGRGLGVARQIVVNEANGKYVIFVDGDVILSNNFVEMQVKFMEENPNVSIAVGRPMLLQGGSLVSSISSLFLYAEGSCGINCASILRPEVLVRVGGFDPNIKGAGEDSDLLNRIQKVGLLVCRNDKARWCHKSRENLRDLMTERLWLGYGGHYLFHKTNARANSNSWRDNPIGAFRFGLKIAFKAYRLTHKKISFLIPTQMVLSSIFWWFGYYKAHKNGYGHEIRG